MASFSSWRAGLQDYLLDWRLIHRTDADMDRLYLASRFAPPSTRVLYEPQRINLFAECVKADEGAPRADAR